MTAFCCGPHVSGFGLDVLDPAFDAFGALLAVALVLHAEVLTLV